MSAFAIFKLWAKVWAARYLRITSKVSEQELDELLSACVGEPRLRPMLEEILKIRR